GRVLRFDNAASKSDGAPADGVLGQPDFTSSTISTTQSGLYRVGAVEIDSAGRLWVADFGNARVLMFEAAATKPDGGAADLVLGQSGFTTGTPATSQEGLRSPWALTLDGDGHLWVTESSNNRVLMFEPDGPAPTATATASETPSQTPTATVSLTPSLTPSQTPTATASETPSLTPSQTPSATPSLTPSVTPSSTPSQTPSVTPSLVPSLTPSRTPSVTPGLTPTAPAQPALVPRAYIPAVRR
ncbi:MAG TPA: hypothetical protein VFS21_34255, partial [Roseiflexaceae bacterium]|nr:hypothetical protein [Roseiflexaceae bacterium]